MACRYRLIFCLALFSLITVQSCKRNGRDLQDATVLVHLPFNPKGLHPTNDLDAARAHVFDLTQRALFKTDVRSLRHEPILLERMPFIDSTGLRLTFDLRHDVTWDDGNPFTANDAIFSIRLCIHPLTANPATKGVFRSVIRNAYVDSLDPYRFYVETPFYHNGNLEIFTEVYMLQEKKWDPSGVISNEPFPSLFQPDYSASESVQNWFNEFNSRENAFDPKRMSGLGPYSITEWVAESHITLQKKEKWWGDQDTLLYNQNEPNKIVFRIIKDDVSAYMAFKNGSLDVSNGLSSARLLKLARLKRFREEYNFDFVDQYAYQYIGLNTKPDGVKHAPLFTDKRVRKAFAHVVPVEDMINVFAKGKAERQLGPLSHLREEYDTTLQPVPFDVDQAIRLLAKAGWKDTDGDHVVDKMIDGNKIPFRFHLQYMAEQPGAKEMVLLIQSCAAKSGMEIIPQPMDLNQFYTRAYEQDFDAMLGSWIFSAGYDDPEQLWHTEGWKQHGNNFCGFGNSSTDSLIQVINTSRDKSVYLNAFLRLQRIIVDEQPYIFLYSPKAKVIIHKRFENPGMYSEKPNVRVNALKLKKHNE